MGFTNKASYLSKERVVENCRKLKRRSSKSGKDWLESEKGL